MTICRSFQASFFWRGSRRRKAGWYVTASLAPDQLGLLLRTPVGLNSYHRPRRFDIGSVMASSVLAPPAPRATMTFGLMVATWRIRNGEQVSHSSRSGVRLLGGRHLMMLAMYTSSRRRPMALIMLFNNCPA